MATTQPNQFQIKAKANTNGDSYDDTVTPSLANFETNPTDISTEVNNIISKLNNLGTGGSGNWYDDFNGASVSTRPLSTLGTDLDTVETKSFLFNRLVLVDIGTLSTNVRILTATSETPSVDASVDGSAEGAVAAGNVNVTTTRTAGSAVAAGDLVSTGQPNALRPLNLGSVFDGATGNPVVTTNGNEMKCLLITERNTNGAFGNTTGGPGVGDRGAIVFVEINATNDGYIYGTASDLPSTVNYTYTERSEFLNLNEWAFLNEPAADAVSGTDVTLTLAATNQTGIVTGYGAKDIDWEIPDSQHYQYQDDGGSNILIMAVDGSGNRTVTIGTASGNDVTTIEGTDLDINVLNDVTIAGGLIVEDGGNPDIRIGQTASTIDTSTGALNLTGAGGLNGTATTGNVMLDASAGAATIDSITSSYFTITANNASAQTLTISATNAGAGAGQVTVTADDEVDITSTNGPVDVNSGAGVTINGASASSFSVDSANLTLETTTSGTLVVNSAGILDMDASSAVTIDSTGGISIDAGSSSNFTAAGTLQLESTSAGDVDINSVDDVTIDGDCIISTVAVQNTGTVVQDSLFNYFQSGNNISTAARVTDVYHTLNAEYISSTSVTGGTVVIRNAATTTAGVVTAFTAGVDASSDASFTPSAASGLSPGDIILIDGADNCENNGLFIVETASGTSPFTVTVSGMLNTKDERWAKFQFVAATSQSAAVYVATVCVLRCNTTGSWEVADGSSAPLSYTELGTTAGSTLQAAYAAGSDISVTSANTSLDFTNSTDATDILNVTRSFAGGGDGVTIDMQASTTGVGLNITSASSGDAIFVNGTGTGSILNLQDGGVDVLDVTGAGAVTFTPTSGQDFSVTGAGTGSQIFFDGFESGDFSVDSATATAATFAISANNTSTGNSSVTIDASVTGAGTGTVAVTADDTINVSTDAVVNSVNIGTGAAAKTVTVGSTTTTSTSTFQSGTGGTSITSTAGVTSTGATDSTFQTDGTSAGGTLTTSLITDNDSTTASSSAVTAVTATASGASGSTVATVDINATTTSATGTSTLNLQTADDGTVNIATSGTGGNTVNVATASGVSNDVNVGNTDTGTTFDATAGSTNAGVHAREWIVTNTFVDRNGATSPAVTRQESTFTAFENGTEGGLTTYYGTGYTTNSGTSTYQVSVVQGSATTDTATAITNNGAATNPTVTTSGSGTFTAGEYVMFTAGVSELNRGHIYEVVSHTGTTLTLAASPSAGSEWCANQVETESSITGTVTAVTVSVLRVGPTGNFSVAEGANDAGTITYTDLGATAATLENAWATNTGSTTTLATNFTGQITDGDTYLIQTETGNHAMISLAAVAGADVVTIGTADSANQVDINAGSGGVLVDATGGTISLDTDVSANFTVTGNTAGTETLTLEVTNAGAGTGVLDVNADDAITVDSTNAGISLGAVTDSDFTVTNTGTGTITNTFSTAVTGNGGTAVVTILADESNATAGTATVNVNATTTAAAGTNTVNIQSADSGTVNIATSGNDVNSVNIATASGVSNTVAVGNSDTGTTFTVTTGNSTQTNSSTGPIFTFPTKHVIQGSNLDRNAATAPSVVRSENTFFAFENGTEGGLTTYYGTGYTTASGTATYQVTVVQGSATTDTATAITNNGAATNPTVTTSGSGTFSTGQYVMFTSGVVERNRGHIYEVVSHTGTTLTLAASPSSGSEWCANQVETESSITGTVTAVTVSVFRVDATGNFSVAEAASDAGTITYTDLGASANTLATVLVNGNVTGGTDIVVSSGDEITGVDSSSVAGTGYTIRGGDYTGAGAGASLNGGDLIFIGGDTNGTSNGIRGGDVTVQGGSILGTAGGTTRAGDVFITGGDASGGGGASDGGNVAITGGASTDQPGDITITGGASSGVTGGDVTIISGEGAAGGTGGAVLITTDTGASGNFTAGAITIQTPDSVTTNNEVSADVTIQAGINGTRNVPGSDVNITAGDSYGGGANRAGNVFITAGDQNGAAGGVGGNVEMAVGDSTNSTAGYVLMTGPNDEDEAIAQFTTTGTNGDSVQFFVGDSDPSGSVTGLAGSLFFRDTGTGAELYQNTSTGSGTTWTQMATGGAVTLESAWSNNTGTTTTLNTNFVGQVTDGDTYLIQTETGLHTLVSLAAVAGADVVTIGATDSANVVDINSGTGGTLIDSTGAISLDTTGTAANFTITNTGTGTAQLDLITEVTGNGGTAITRVEANESNATAGTATVQIEALVTGAGGGGPTITIGGEAASTINIGAAAFANTININTGAAAANTTIGNTTSTSAVTVNTGTGGFTVNTTAADVDVNSGAAVTVDAFSTGDASSNHVTLTGGSSSTAATASGTVRLVAGAPGAGGATTPVALSTAASANVDATHAVALMLNSGTGTGGGHGFRFYSMDQAADPSHSAPAGSFAVVVNAATTPEWWLNETTGTGSGTTWSKVVTTTTQVTRNFFQDTCSSAVSAGSAITTSDLTGGVLPVKPSTGFSFDTDAEVYINGILMMNGTGNDVTSGTGNNINLESGGPSLRIGDVLSVVYYTNSSSNTA